MDPTRSLFDRSLLHEYDEWKGLIPTFAYHGMNTYAYLLAKFGKFLNPATQNEEDTFDFITIQLYEGYSHAQYKVVIEKQSPTLVLVEFVKSVVNGWEVDFSEDKDLQFPIKTRIQITPDKLVIGLANGWAGDGKFLLIYPKNVSI